MAALVHPPLKIKGIPTIFGEPFEKNITFCIDTSGSMYKGLEVVKEHLLETLLKLSSKSQPTSFNIIEFNSEVTQWADKMVKCTPETVAVAADWVKKLSAKTGTNTQDALLTALGDPGCEAVYIITDGLPDQHPTDILDNVAYAARGRPIHCVYLVTEDKTDTVASEFLEDLACDSYGSFHVVTLTTHGLVDRITPIYRADHAHEKIIRTLNGTMHNPMKTCSVGTTLKIDPDESMYLTPRNSFYNSLPHPMYPPFNSLWWIQPYRYYYPHGWSRYHTSKGWLKAHEQMIESVENSDLSPGAGALLIGKSVLARRLEDGYFYLGKVQSQLLSDKFLIAFGPCKHGKYKETSYQDTFVYDIIGYDDAQLHTVLTHDKVLAPWEPEGERYGPGVVIEGHEKRLAEGPDDEQITVTFSNGKTAKVPSGTALWIPEQVYERLSLELKMPREARETLQTQNGYPKENLTGYPTSGPEAYPEEYELPRKSFNFDMNPLMVETRPWQYPPAPVYTATPPQYSSHVTKTKTKTAVRSEDMNKLVPGTNMTCQDLTDKVTSQLVEHKLFLDEKETEKEYQERVEKEKRQKILEEEIEKNRQKRREFELEKEMRHETNIEMALERQKERLWALEREREEEQERLMRLEREQQAEIEKIRRMEDDRLREGQRRMEDDRLREEQRAIEIERERQLDCERLLRKREKQEENLLKKSVSFKDDLAVEDLDRASDSGIQTGSNKEVSESYDYGYDGYDGYDGYREYTRDDSELRRSTGSFDPRLRFCRRRRAQSARPPWKKYWGSDPAPPLIDPNTPGPFRETALQTPLEAKDSRYPYMAEWTSPVYKYVDPYAKHDYSNSVELLLKTPKPPDSSVQKQEAGEEVSKVMGSRQMTEEAKEEARREYKRQKTIQRRINWENRLCHEDKMKFLMEDQHRERIQAQIERDQKRQEKEQEMIRQSREAKKHISAELRTKIETDQQKEKEKQERRLEAMRQRREQREAEAAKKAQKLEEINEKRKQYKIAQSQIRWDNTHKRLDVEDAENNKLSAQRRNAKLNRIGHFRKLEEEGQRNKDLRIGVTGQHLAMYRSQVLP